MAQMTLEYPVELPLLLKTLRAKFEAEVRFLAAAKLYELGRISSGKAAQMAELPRVEFLTSWGSMAYRRLTCLVTRFRPRLTQHWAARPRCEGSRDCRCRYPFSETPRV